MPSLQLSVPGQDTTLVMARASGLGQPDAVQLFPDVVQVAFGDVAQDEVLLLGGAGASAGVAAHDVGDGAELRAVEVAALGLHHDGVVAFLSLGLSTLVSRHLANSSDAPTPLGAGATGGVSRNSSSISM